MANVVQMGVDAFWRSLQDLEAKAHAEKARLEADRLRLQHAYTATRQEANAVRARDHRAMLDPLIHANSENRLRYSSLVLAFNRAVNGAAGALRSMGLAAPNLSGLSGPEVILVPVVAVAALGTAWAIYATVHEQNASQGRLIDAALNVMNNPNSTPEERQQAVGVIANESKKKPPGSDPLGLSNLVPVLGLLALIVVVPPLLNRVRSNPRHRARRRRRRHAA